MAKTGENLGEDHKKAFPCILMRFLPKIWWDLSKRRENYLVS